MLNPNPGCVPNKRHVPGAHLSNPCGITRIPQTGASSRRDSSIFPTSGCPAIHKCGDMQSNRVARRARTRALRSICCKGIDSDFENDNEVMIPILPGDQPYPSYQEWPSVHIASYSVRKGHNRPGAMGLGAQGTPGHASLSHPCEIAPNSQLQTTRTRVPRILLRRS